MVLFSIGSRRTSSPCKPPMEFDLWLWSPAEAICNLKVLHWPKRISRSEVISVLLLTARHMRFAVALRYECDDEAGVATRHRFESLVFYADDTWCNHLRSEVLKVGKKPLKIADRRKLARHIRLVRIPSACIDAPNDDAAVGICETA